MCWVFMIQLSAQNNYSILPQPVKLTKAAGEFTFKNNTAIVVSKEAASFSSVAKSLSAQLNASFGLNLSVKTGNAKSNAVNFSYNGQLAEEG